MFAVPNERTVCNFRRERSVLHQTNLSNVSISSHQFNAFLMVDAQQAENYFEIKDPCDEILISFSLPEICFIRVLIYLNERREKKRKSATSQPSQEKVLTSERKKVFM